MLKLSYTLHYTPFRYCLNFMCVKYVTSTNCNMLMLHSYIYFTLLYLHFITVSCKGK
jgi:hypothetical protein